jgi:hypothetical protein
MLSRTIYEIKADWSDYMNWVLRLALLVWVSPNSLLGIMVGMVGLISGGRVQVRCHCLEFYGGLVTWLLNLLPPQGVLAMTLGHIIIGQTPSGLALCREHERVHVRQYERWGPLFIPAYLACSVYLWLQKRDPYRENPFEIEAYAIADPHQILPRDRM